MTHPITPPQELRDKWLDEAPNTSVYDYLIDSAAQWGADQELEACCEWLMTNRQVLSASALGAARRPKPPSLKEQALEALDMHFAAIGEGQCYQAAHKDTIRRALEALPDNNPQQS